MKLKLGMVEDNLWIKGVQHQYKPMFAYSLHVIIIFLHTYMEDQSVLVNVVQ